MQNQQLSSKRLDAALYARQQKKSAKETFIPGDRPLLSVYRCCVRIEAVDISLFTGSCLRELWPGAKNCVQVDGCFLSDLSLLSNIDGVGDGTE